jgi:hypothetical protein
MPLLSLVDRFLPGVTSDDASHPHLVAALPELGVSGRGVSRRYRDVFVEIGAAAAGMGGGVLQGAPWYSLSHQTLSYSGQLDDATAHAGWANEIKLERFCCIVQVNASGATVVSGRGDWTGRLPELDGLARLADLVFDPLHTPEALMPWSRPLATAQNPSRIRLVTANRSKHRHPVPIPRLSLLPDQDGK